MITIPFDLELAKKINNGERNGMIVTDGDNYRVEFVYHREESFPILGVIHTENMKIKATKYRNDYRVWLDYAGDYRNENIE